MLEILDTSFGEVWELNRGLSACADAWLMRPAPAWAGVRSSVSIIRSVVAFRFDGSSMEVNSPFLKAFPINIAIQPFDVSAVSAFTWVKVEYEGWFRWCMSPELSDTEGLTKSSRCGGSKPRPFQTLASLILKSSKVC